MARRSRTRRLFPVTLAVVALYGAMLLLAPSLHHDFACHQNSRTHCTSCIGNQTAPQIEAGVAPIDALALVSSQIELRPSAALQTAALFSDSGRSPPV